MLLPRPLYTHPRTVAVSAFILLYVCAVQYFYRVSARDPSSVFFNPKIGFQRIYSDVREAQADRFIHEENKTPKWVPGIKSQKPELCVGIAGVQREGVHYFSSAVGSLLDGLSPEERSRLYLAVMIAQSNATKHEAWPEAWLHDLPDELFTYSDLSELQQSRLLHVEATDKNFDFKILIDYVLMLNACLNTKAPYILILEDDVLALDGWFHRAMQAIHELERKPEFKRSLYVRLFYTDKYLGWNSEQWPRYLSWSIVTEFAVLAGLLGLRKIGFSRYLSVGVIFLALAVFTPASILLFFAAGRLTVAPPGHGLTRMDSYGCCSQALLYPRAQVPHLVTYIEEQKKGKVDVLVEKYANLEEKARWAWSPGLFQHVGTKSASRKAGTGNAKWGLPATASIWNFRFEQNNAEALRAEHEGFVHALKGNW
ncbi:hypothetical protein K431DRAFT_316965 [Polychaeton citri CBS 116435]|uniref:Integral membrane protein n=1 Tax=Polychaeton citri CBS 116435 TaxID=1314669 RepID=A0A9P4QJH9_9PEZI|nr:hypothetical protein K431DRAFT_316965 [Polychaeton citri CBS 116435]